MIRSWRLFLLVALAVPAATVPAQSPAQSPAPSLARSNAPLDASTEALSSVAPASTDCTYEFGATNGNFRWCISEHGNLMRFQSPNGQEHVRVGGLQEGYVLCTPDEVYGDVGITAGGWGPPTVLGRTSGSVTIRRETTDGRFRLDQRWTRDTVERDLIVRMTLKNLGPRQTVMLMRNVDPDVNNDFDDDFWDQSAHTGWVRDIHAFTMTALTRTRAHRVVIDAPSLINVDCAPFQAEFPGGPGDPGVSVIYRLGSMRTNAIELVEVGYRVQ